MRHYSTSKHQALPWPQPCQDPPPRTIATCALVWPPVVVEVVVVTTRVEEAVEAAAAASTAAAPSDVDVETDDLRACTALVRAALRDSTSASSSL